MPRSGHSLRPLDCADGSDHGAGRERTTGDGEGDERRARKAAPGQRRPPAQRAQRARRRRRRRRASRSGSRGARPTARAAACSRGSRRAAARRARSAAQRRRAPNGRASPGARPGQLRRRAVRAGPKREIASSSPCSAASSSRWSRASARMPRRSPPARRRRSGELARRVVELALDHATTSVIASANVCHSLALPGELGPPAPSSAGRRGGADRRRRPGAREQAGGLEPVERRVDGSLGEVEGAVAVLAQLLDDGVSVQRARAAASPAGAGRRGLSIPRIAKYCDSRLMSSSSQAEPSREPRARVRPRLLLGTWPDSYQRSPSARSPRREGLSAASARSRPAGRPGTGARTAPRGRRSGADRSARGSSQLVLEVGRGVLHVLRDRCGAAGDQVERLDPVLDPGSERAHARALRSSRRSRSRLRQRSPAIGGSRPTRRTSLHGVGLGSSSRGRPRSPGSGRRSRGAVDHVERERDRALFGHLHGLIEELPAVAAAPVGVDHGRVPASVLDGVSRIRLEVACRRAGERDVVDADLVRAARRRPVLRLRVASRRRRRTRGRSSTRCRRRRRRRRAPPSEDETGAPVDLAQHRSGRWYPWATPSDRSTRWATASSARCAVSSA